MGAKLKLTYMPVGAGKPVHLCGERPPPYRSREFMANGHQYMVTKSGYVFHMGVWESGRYREDAYPRHIGNRGSLEVMTPETSENLENSA